LKRARKFRGDRFGFLDAVGEAIHGKVLMTHPMVNKQRRNFLASVGRASAHRL
jgi:hypothetical protein